MSWKTETTLTKQKKDIFKMVAGVYRRKMRNFKKVLRSYLDLFGLEGKWHEPLS